MENTDNNYGNKKEIDKTTGNTSNESDQEELEFENPSTDPGFETSEEELEGEEDERDGNIDSSKSISEMQEEDENDALNYKNDRENGAYNPKNI